MLTATISRPRSRHLDPRGRRRHAGGQRPSNGECEGEAMRTMRKEDDALSALELLQLVDGVQENQLSGISELCTRAAHGASSHQVRVK